MSDQIGRSSRSEPMTAEKSSMASSSMWIIASELVGLLETVKPACLRGDWDILLEDSQRSEVHPLRRFLLRLRRAAALPLLRDLLCLRALRAYATRNPKSAHQLIQNTWAGMLRLSSGWRTAAPSLAAQQPSPAPKPQTAQALPKPRPRALARARSRWGLAARCRLLVLRGLQALQHVKIPQSPGDLQRLLPCARREPHITHGVGHTRTAQTATETRPRRARTCSVRGGRRRGAGTSLIDSGRVCAECQQHLDHLRLLSVHRPEQRAPAVPAVQLCSAATKGIGLQQELRMCGWGPCTREASVWEACCWYSGVISMS